MLIILLGVGLLVWVFYIAYGLYQAPASTALDLRFTGDAKKDPTVTTIGAHFMWLLFRVAYLLLMSVAGSLIANKGINLFLSSLHHSALAPHTPIGSKPNAPVVQAPKSPESPGAQS
jgi:hypothetical protein